MDFLTFIYYNRFIIRKKENFCPMKRAVALWILAGLIFTLTACKKDVVPTLEPTKPSELAEKAPTQDGQPAPEQELVTFWEDQPEMKMEEAQEIIQKEEKDVTTEEYRQAVYTVNEEVATQIVEEAAKTKSQTAAVQDLFSGIFFKFIEGDSFKSPEVAKQLSKKGTYALDAETGYYRFSFHDRTLAQAAAGMREEHAAHSIQEYTFVLEWLLADPNVEVKALLK